MKKVLILASMAAIALVSCSKNGMETSESKQLEMSIIPMAGNVASRGYVTGEVFEECTYEALHAESPETVYRDMQMSAYLYPQDGSEGNYFVNKTFAKGKDDYWHATPAVYWPVGGTLDFLAFSLSKDNSKNVTVAWDQENAASKVVLGVPAENSQNDILFASVSGEKSKSSAAAVKMTFDHAQAWLQFALKTTSGDNIITLKRIVLEDIYNAGKLTVTNNGGKALASWDFTAETKKDVTVDNNRAEKVTVLTGDVQYLDMLIPQQKKTSIVLYYTLAGSDQELSYRFPTDLKTWLMGEKYIYNITINTAEITVDPEVKQWNDVSTTSTLY